MISTIFSLPLNVNYIDVFVYNVGTKCLLDSGASFNAISKKYLDAIIEDTKERIQIKYEKDTCNVADGNECTIIGTVNLPVHIDKTVFDVKFSILPTLSQNIILGIEFFNKNNVCLDFGKKTVSFNQPAPVYAIHNIEVPPKTEIIIPASIKSNNVSDGTQGECAPFPTLQLKSLLAARAAVTVNKNQVPVRIYNYSNKTVKIQKGQRVAILAPWESNVELIAESEYKENNANSSNTLNNLSKSNDQKIPPPDIDLSQSDMIKSQKAKLKQLLAEYSDCFVYPCNNNIGMANLVEHKIEVLPNTRSYSRLPYRSSPQMRAEMDKLVKQQIKEDIIEPTDSGSWASPALLIKKKQHNNSKETEYRMVIDFRQLNAATITQSLRVPNLEQTIDDIGIKKPVYFSTLDLQSSFHQVGLNEESRHYTGFLTHSGKYRYKRMPQGLKNASAQMAHLMDLVLKGINQQFNSGLVLCYIDDIIIASTTFEEHIETLKSTFERLRAANLKLKPSKCSFVTKKVNYLGFVLTQDGISPNPDKIKAITDFPVPKKVKDIRSFLGVTGFYRKHIRSYSNIAKPLYNLTHKEVKFVWNEECQKAFDTLKNKIADDVVLMYPNFYKEFILSTDASDTAIGCCLSQYDSKNNLRPVSFAGRSLTQSESKMSVSIKEIIAVVWAVEHYKVYLEGSKFKLYTDHAALSFILGNKENLPSKLHRYALIMQSYDFDIFHIKGLKNKVPDALSRREYDETRTKEDDVLDSYPDLNALFNEDHSNEINREIHVIKQPKCVCNPVPESTTYYYNENTIPSNYVLENAIQTETYPIKSI